jgi:hypothetical protein
MYFKTYIELVNYFQSIPTTITALKGVTVGSDEDVIEQQGTLINYPYLRVDTPEIVFMNDDENAATRYTFRMYVFSNEPAQTNGAENQVLSDMATLSRRIINKLYADADNGNFDLITGNKQGDVIRRWSADNCFGWWWNVVIDLYTDECD